MTRLLVVHHSPGPGVRSLTEAVLAGTRDEAVEGVEVVERAALEATPDDVLGADGYLLGTTANFGYMSGALKHFFDTTYHQVIEHTEGRPFGVYVHGRNDTTGAVRSVLSITTGLRWRQAAEVLEVVGDVDAEHREAAYDLGGTIAALLATPS